MFDSITRWCTMPFKFNFFTMLPWQQVPTSTLTHTYPTRHKRHSVSLTTGCQSRLRMTTAWSRWNHWRPRVGCGPQSRWQGDLRRIRRLRLLNGWWPRPLEASHLLLQIPEVGVRRTDTISSWGRITPLTSHRKTLLPGWPGLKWRGWRSGIKP